RSQPVRAGIAQGDPHPRPDGRGNTEPHPARRYPRLAPRTGAVDFILIGRGFFLRPRRHGTAAVEPTATGRRGSATPAAARACPARTSLATASGGRCDACATSVRFAAAPPTAKTGRDYDSATVAAPRAASQAARGQYGGGAGR